MSKVTPLRGRPRDAKVTEAILTAVVDLLVETGSVDAVTMRAVAERARVGLPSLYRRWPTKDELIVEALATASAHVAPTPDTGSLRTDLLALARTVAEGLAGKGRDAGTLALLLSPASSEGTAVRDQVQQVRRTANRKVVARAVQRGELPPDVDADLLLDLILGPLWLERMTHGRAPHPARLQKLVDTVLRAFPAESATTTLNETPARKTVTKPQRRTRKEA